MIKLYGIPNCDSVKKAKHWLAENEVKYEFHDYKKMGADKDSLKSWSKQVGWETLLNRRGSTWRKLSEAERGTTLNENRAIQLMVDNSSLIKRPVVTVDDTVMVGFDETEFAKHLLDN